MTIMGYGLIFLGGKTNHKAMCRDCLHEEHVICKSSGNVEVTCFSASALICDVCPYSKSRNHL